MENYFATTNLPLFAADFDYFRIPREKWELMLIRLKQMGVDLLTLTIPWGFHEFNQGTVDLYGATHARRDLTGLLSLCTALEYHCILRLGPYSNHGIVGGGIPLWLLNQDDYEAVLPDAVEGWYKAASHALTDKQWPHGPIIALYIDSEPAEGYAPLYSKQLTEVKWRIWLRKHYEGIEALNAAYGTDYKTVNDVEFPKTWAKGKRPVEKDAREFLEKVRSDTQTRYTEILFNADWQVPVYPRAKEIYPELPDLQSYPLTDTSALSALKPESTFLNLQHPIQIDPVPADVGLNSVWAIEAPIRADGSLRRKFWAVREFLWQHRLSKVTSTRGKALRASFGTNSLITSGSDASVRFNLPAKTRSMVYRLRLNGELVVENRLSVKQGKLSGPYIVEDEIDQIDLLLLLSDASAPINDVPLTYLRNLLLAQMKTLTRCADLAATLGESLSVAQDVSTDTGAAEHSVHTLNTLEEARRGLSEADAALRKAMESIGGLEEGFATILDHGGLEMIPQPASAPVTISPEIFESVAREQIIKIGTVCTETASRLKAASTALQKSASADDFTVEQYQQSYETAVSAARDARETLSKAVEQIRVELLSERLPLIGWRIHDQVLEIVESLRWGVLRGKV